MNPEGQRVKLNDSHFIPVLGFGTAVPKEVTEVVWGWDINSSGCNMNGRDLGCQALSTWLAPLATNLARTMSCEKRESIQSSLCIRVWGCAHLQITLGFPPVSVSFPAWQKRRDLAVKITDCQLLCFEGNWNGRVSLCISLVPELLPPSKKMWPREVFEVEGFKDEVNRN